MDKQQEATGYSSPPPYTMPTAAPTPLSPGAVPPNYNTQYAQPISTQYGMEPTPVVGVAAPPMPPGGAWQQTPQGPVYINQTTTMRNTSNIDSGTFKTLRTAIPELPMGAAITLCVINCILPGIGTIIAGFCVFCCGNPGQSDGGKFGTFCINFWVGIGQIITLIMGIGWVWSIMWGVAFIAISDEGRRKREGGNTTTTTVMTTTTAAPPGSYPGQAVPVPH